MSRGVMEGEFGYAYDTYSSYAAMRKPIALFLPVLLLSLSGTNERADGETGQIRGQVIDAATGNPIAGASIAIARLENAYIYFSSATDIEPIPERIGSVEKSRALAPFVRSGKSDAQGNFEFDKLASGQFGIVVADPKRGVAVLTANASDQKSPLQIKLERPTRVIGRLANLKLDPAKNYVNLECESPYPWLSLSVRLSLDSEGKFDSGLLPALGRWSVVEWEWELNNAYTGAILKWPIELVPGIDNRVDIDVRGGGTLPGRVIGPTGEPISFASVIARSSRGGAVEHGAITGPDGGFDIGGLAEGPHQIVVNRWRPRRTQGCGPGPRDVHLEQIIDVGSKMNPPLELVVREFSASVEVGDAAPNFKTQLLDHREIELKGLSGKVVLLDFWATWCGMCQAALPSLKELHQAHAKDGLVMIGVNVDIDARKAQYFIQRHSIPWSQTVLGPIDTNPISRLYNVNSTPTIILIGRDGNVLARDVSQADLEKVIRTAISVKVPSQAKGR